jgi:hypothetical protein
LGNPCYSCSSPFFSSFRCKKSCWVLNLIEHICFSLFQHNVACRSTVFQGRNISN